LQVRCRDSELCSAAGAKVVVTDQARTSNRTALVLSAAAYAAMASAGKAARLRDRRVVDVEYKRYLGAATLTRSHGPMMQSSLLVGQGPRD
jgi:hypothetical protein